MNVFGRKEVEVIGEGDLIAFHLNELSPRRMKAMRRAISQSTALTAELAAIGEALDGFKVAPLRVDRAVLDRNWEALRPLMIRHSTATPKGARRRPLLAGGLVAGGLLAGTAAITLVVMGHHGAPVEGAHADGEGRPTSTRDDTPTQPLQGSGLAAKPAAGDPGFYRLPSEPSAKARLGGGVFHPDLESSGSAIHLLAPARIGAATMPPPLPLSAQPLSAQPHDAQPQIAAGPLTLEPAGPGAAPAEVASTEGPPVPGQGAPAVGAAGQTRPGARIHSRHTTDIMLGMGGMLILPHHSLTAGTESRTLTVSPAVSAIAALHQQFRPTLGYRVTLSYARPNFEYTYAGGNYEAGQINSRIFEVAGTYVIEGPHRGRLSTSADAGAALLAFLPTEPSPNVSYGFRTAGVLGVSVDVALTRHVGVRASYRAQIFRTPDFRYDGGTIPVTTSVTESNEPSLGITYKFGKE